MEETINNIIENCDVEKLKLMVDNGFEITTSHLEKALEYNCEENMYEIIEEILNQKIIPDTGCFLSFFENIYVEKTIDEYGFYSGKCISDNKIFQLLINYGYKITQVDFLLLTQNYLYIDDIKKHNLPIDKYIIRECNKLCFFPYDEIIPNKNTILSILTENPELKIYKKLEKKYDLDPDESYISALIDSKKASAIKTIKYIHKKNIILTAGVFYNVVRGTTTKINPNFDKYCSILLEGKKFDFDYDNYDFYNKEDCNNLFLHLSKNNNNIIKMYESMDLQKEKNNDFDYDGRIKIYEDMMMKHNVACDVNFLKLLCFRLKYCDNHENSFIHHLIETKNIHIDDECLMIMKLHGTIDYFFFY